MIISKVVNTNGHQATGLNNLARIIWPERGSLQKTMPDCFQQSFGKKVAIIIDCFEIFIERPSNLQARTSTW